MSTENLMEEIRKVLSKVTRFESPDIPKLFAMFDNFRNLALDRIIILSHIIFTRFLTFFGVFFHPISPNCVHAENDVRSLL